MDKSFIEHPLLQLSLQNSISILHSAPIHWIISTERLLASSLQNDRWHLLQKLNLFKERWISAWFCKGSFENVFSIQICYILVKIELSFERLQYVYEEKRLHLLQIGCYLAILHVGAEALLLCRQLHKRAINNLWPGNYRTFWNTHGPGSFCLTNLSLRCFNWIQQFIAMADVLYFTTQFYIKIDFFKCLVQLGQSSPAKSLEYFGNWA